MNRRQFITKTVGTMGVATTLAGCNAGGEVLLRERNITATSSEQEWDVELEEGRELELAVTLQTGMQVDGYVHRKSDEEEIVWLSGTSEGQTRHEEFEVPSTDTYVVSMDPHGSKGTITLREA